MPARVAPFWRAGKWGNNSTPEGTALIFCDAHEVAIIVEPIAEEQARRIVEAHNDAIKEMIGYGTA